MRILVISRTPWRKDNSFGNTYSNFFSKMEDVEIANIYLGDGWPDKDNKNLVSYYCLSEEKMAKSIIKRGLSKSVGFQFSPDSIPDSKQNDKKQQSHYKSLFSMAKVKRWNVLFCIREFIWKHGKYDKQDVLKFVKDFKPDVIFLSFYYAKYVSNFALFLKRYIDVPMISEAAIDIYTLKQLSFDPIFWLHRLGVRKVVRKTADKSEFLFVISEKQRREYTNILNKHCKVLYKAPDNHRKLYDYSRMNNPVKFLFTGNISSRRWKSLSLLGNVLKELKFGQLDIYTPTPLTRIMKKSLANSVVHNPVSAQEVVKLQNEADVLIHAESFDLKSKLAVRYSISTKVMDYISTERCILAIGPSDVASIEFLKDKNLALTASSKDEIMEVVKEIRDNNSIVFECAKRNRDYVQQRSQEESLQQYIRKHLSNAIENYKVNRDNA